ncbi:bumetanide-sensitive sodium-(potassium)-chloride cotransporter isoform X2 [Adelges cooleyi]|uniref:bumetanide-sensitive sodium-(potassium)-chloride cotransporter isoform X2 n=1 Tax=Adelges cooleyi TaxID=133065 RepID=UPI00217F28D3|nr:bumetanide-sensitive sodium-(potassium)-chloride cotransporter isoform X2 [Adelges cooleyi]
MDSTQDEVELKSVVTDSKRTRFQVNLVDSEPHRVRLDSASSDDNKYRSFRQLTREALPRLDNYRNIMSVHVACRPTLDELHNNDMAEKKMLAQENEPSRPVLRKHEQGWIQGVLIRNLVQIWGLMLFLRLAWVVCTTGLVSGIVIIFFGGAITTITALSMSAISTNGVLKEGGTYFMISRSLGPEFGACIGVIYSIALAAACAMHLVGFCEMVQILMTSANWSIMDGGVQDMRLLGIGFTAALLCATLGGIRSRIQIHAAVLVLIVIAILNVLIGAIVGPQTKYEKDLGFIGFSWTAINHNLFKNFESVEDWFKSFWCGFAVFFPAASGFLAGTNKSGELKDSLRAIPRGSLTSIFISSSVYIGLAFIVGSTLGDQSVSNKFSTISSCDSPNKLYAVNHTIGIIALYSPLVYASVLASTLTASFSSFLAAPKVFQMLCNDKLYNNLSWFGFSTKSGEPIRADVLATIIVLLFILPGDLNTILPSISNVMLSVYALINFSTFHASLVKPIGWRPTFKLYNMWLSLAGSMLCVVLMFVICWWIALVTLVAILALYLIVSYQKPDVNWGTSTQAQTYKQALIAVHSLIRVEDHVKNFRPQLLVLTGMPSSRPPLTDFAHLITKNLSLLVCGNMIKTPTSQKLLEIYSKRANNWLNYHKIKGFYVQIDGTNFEDGAKSLMQTVGLGKLKPNIVMLGYKTNWFKCSTNDLNMYFNVLHKALDIHMGVCILRVKSGLNYSNSILIDENQLDMIVNRKTSFISEEPFLHSRSQSMSTVEKHDIGDDSEEDSELLAKTSYPVYKNPNEDIAEKHKVSKNQKANIVKGTDGYDLPKETIYDITRFQRKQKKGTIDVWWLYDDGGLTLLLPYIISTRGNWSSCKLRVFTIANKKDQLEFEQRSIASLLAKFRIDYSDLLVITDLLRKPHEETLAFYTSLIKSYKPKGQNNEGISESELTAMKEKTNRHLRLRELLLENSQEANLIVMTLPMPRKNVVPAPLYMSWLETLTQGMPPFLLVRGNQSSVLTFYS